MSEMNQLLTTGALRLVAYVREKQIETRQETLGLHHWLFVLLERHAPMLEGLSGGLNSAALKDELAKKISQGDPGAALTAESVAQQAYERARQRGKPQAAERDVAQVVLAAAGYALAETPASNGGAAGAPTTPTPAASSRLPTPTIEQFGRDLTQAARDGKLTPIVGREEEISLMIETLCRRTKRNPVLVGPAGVGKTALVEGLAQRIVQGQVPSALANVRVLALLPTALVAGAGVQGELEKRMREVIREASQEGVILFIDEIHSIIGAGGMAGSSDIASMLKPVLARGELACIAATTTDEYRRFIESDTALERRFQPIRVNELPPAQTLGVLNTLRAELVKKNPVEVDDAVLTWLIDFGQQFMRNRYFPDKAVDLLEQCFAYAIANGKTRLDLSDAQTVAQRMVGMPLALDQRLGALQQLLTDQGVFSPDEITLLINRLQVTLRGLDLRNSRANAVLLFSGEAAHSADRIAEIFAQALFGSADRTIAIDCSRMWHPEDINLLIGAPPGYVGYSDSLPLHQLAQTPWCVVLFQNIGSCHPAIREVVAQALAEGRLVDGRGKPIYFSDSVVLMTAEIEIHSQRSTGFLGVNEPSETLDLGPAIVEAVGLSLAQQIDLFLPGLAKSSGLSEKWLKDHLLADLTERYQKQGVQLLWDKSMVEWLQKRAGAWSERDWENWVDSALSPILISRLPSPGQTNQKLTIGIEQDQIVIQ